MNSYLFYDIESTGLNTCFDQILRFAAVRTDFRLDEYDTYSIDIRLRPDIVIAPRAILTNQIAIQDTVNGRCEYEAIQQIHALLNAPGTISIGYNTLGFDDEFLRFSFYRNLLPPYTHQYKNGCHRVDLFPITILFWLYRRESLKWPELDHQVSLKLEHLSQANQLAQGPAHTAMVDVRASIELANRLYRHTEMWNYLLGYFRKDLDMERIAKLPSMIDSELGSLQMGLLVSGEFGYKNNFQIPVISLGRSNAYSNQTLWLRLDMPDLQATEYDTIDDTTWVVRKKLGEPPIILPPLKRYMDAVDPDRIQLANDNIEWLKSRSDLCNQIIMYHRDFTYPEIPNIDTDAALYQIGFFSNEDQRLFTDFHRVTWEKRIKLIDSFRSETIKELGRRVIFRNYTGKIPRKINTAFKDYMHQINPLMDADAPVDYREQKRLTPRRALDQIEKIERDSQLTSLQKGLLKELKQYVLTQFAFQ